MGKVARQNPGHPVKSEFQRNKKSFFNMSIPVFCLFLNVATPVVKVVKEGFLGVVTSELSPEGCVPGGGGSGEARGITQFRKGVLCHVMSV